MLNEMRAQRIERERENCSLAKDLYKSFRKRTEERRTVYSPPLNFLKNRFAKGPEKILYLSISLIASQKGGPYLHC